jgi:hypothetical protein
MKGREVPFPAFLFWSDYQAVADTSYPPHPKHSGNGEQTYRYLAISLAVFASGALLD